MKELILSFFLSGWGADCTNFFEWKTTSLIQVKKVEKLHHMEEAFEKINIFKKACKLDLNQNKFPLNCHKFYYLSAKHLCPQKKKDFLKKLAETCMDFEKLPIKLEKVSKVLSSGLLSPFCLKQFKKHKERLKYQNDSKNINLLLKYH